MEACDGPRANRQYEPYVSHRMIIMLAWSALLLWGSALLHAVLESGGTVYYIGAAVCMFLSAASAISMIFGFGWYIMAFRRKDRREAQTFHGLLLSLLALMLLVCCCLLLFSPALGLKMAYVFLSLCCLLFLVYSVYPRELFALCLTHGAIALCLAALSALEAPQTLRVGALTGGLALCLGTAVLFWVTRSRSGGITLGAVTFNLFGESLAPPFVLASYAAAGLLLSASFLWGNIVAVMGTAVIALFLLALLIRETVRMM